ncbi:hypothetical protein ASZ78_017040 [Callipepla squamata]|uniref:G-protein coupled receptors family 1 profile domain-containing protein n=1 Tax=Callipepla squamata TaxID=9009 RepID=A0A226MCJ4_CALSU|nr:hypothetical protein ASZ78_017040 [Callipepla squamata]
MFLLLAMAYDRYVAICKPLRYTVLVNRTVCHVLVGASWGSGFLHGIIVFALTIKLPFCGLNILDSFFCDIRQLAKLACANTYTVELLMFLNNGIVIVTCFVLLLISYTVLLLKLQTHSTKAKKENNLHLCFPHCCGFHHVWPSYLHLCPTLSGCPSGKSSCSFPYGHLSLD